MIKKIDKYFSQHPTCNALSHGFIGLGIGILFTHVLFDPHPVRWGLLFIAGGALGYIYAYMSKK